MIHKVCKTCKNETDRFEFGKNVCDVCRQKQKVKNITRSHYRYLKNLFVQLRNKREKQGLKWSLTPEDLYEIWDEQEGRCALTGILLTYDRINGGSDTNVSIDRIKPKGKYVKKNIQLVTKKVNLLKHTMEQNDLLAIVGKIYEKKIS